jgi:DNA-binding MarR family transcriptional regulator
LAAVPYERDDDPGLGLLQDQLTLLVRRARVFFRTAAEVAHPELKAAGYALLSYLVDEGPLRASALVEHFGTDKGVISRQLSQLEHLGLVHRLPDPADGRAQLVEATADGRQRCLDARALGRSRMREQLAGWDDGDVEALGRLIGRLNSSLGARPDDRDV